MPKIRPISVITATINMAFTILIALPATIAGTLLAAVLLASPEPMAEQLADGFINLQATGRDRAPEQLHFEVCEKASIVGIFCEKQSVVGFTANEVADAVKRSYFALLLTSVGVWLLVFLPSNVRKWRAGAKALSGIPAAKA